MKSKFFNGIVNTLGPVVRVLFRIHPHYIENEPDESEGPYVLICNHISNADPVFICAGKLKQQPHYMAKKSLFKIPLLRGIIKAMGAFPVNRGGADVNAIKHAIKLLEDGKCVGIFPQGHRYQGVDPKTTDVKTGAAMLSCKTESQILPCFIKTKKRKISFLTRVDIIVGKPISFSELAYDPEAKGEYARISSYVFEKVCELENTDVSKKKA